MIHAKNELLKFSLSQLKHLDLGSLDKGVSGQASDRVGSLDRAWGKIQVNLETEPVDYAKVDPTKVPAFWSKPTDSRNSSGGKHAPHSVDWLNQDSIESLKQASAGFSIPPNSSRRMDPIRLSVPNPAKAPSGPYTHRTGRNGNKLGDSQQYMLASAIGGVHGGGNLLGTK